MFLQNTKWTNEKLSRNDILHDRTPLMSFERITILLLRLLSRNYDILFRYYEIIPRTYDLMSQTYESCMIYTITEKRKIINMWNWRHVQLERSLPEILPPFHFLSWFHLFLVIWCDLPPGVGGNLRFCSVGPFHWWAK